MSGFYKKILIWLLAMALLSPLGIILPEMFHAGKAWGEWSTETVEKDKGYAPKGMKRDATIYKAPIPNYNLGKEKDSLWRQSGSYILSGFIGMGVIALLTFGVIKLLPRK